jgi:uncharacterized protein
MDRTIISEFQKWNDMRERKPLLVRGARQTGKSWAIEHFGRSSFRQTITLNFDLHPRFASCFTSADPKVIIPSIELLTGRRISAETLLFLDEIQECPEAIRSLRYFREQRPDIPVIGAGSLLDFALNAESFRMPVGRVSFLTMYPLSFREFLAGSGKEQQGEYLDAITGRKIIKSAEGNSLIPGPVHEDLLESLRLYMLLGGMPGVLNTWFADPSHPTDAFRVQDELLQTFRRDFGKYASRAKHPYMEKVFMSAPSLTGKRIKYVNIDPDVRSRELKYAIDLLSSAGLVRKICRSDASGLPLGASVSREKFKLLFLDVGLSGNICGLSDQFVLQKDLVAINSGSVAEQYAGQELLLLQEPWKDASLYYWDRDVKSSSAEVDYVIQAGTSIVPVEVKSGKTGRLRSLHRFMEEKKSPLGVRLYTGQPHYDGSILSLPLYLTGNLIRILRDFL